MQFLQRMGGTLDGASLLWSNFIMEKIINCQFIDFVPDERGMLAASFSMHTNKYSKKELTSHTYESDTTAWQCHFWIYALRCCSRYEGMPNLLANLLFL